MKSTSFVYSFDLTSYESGRFTATRYPAGVAVGGDWVCVAPSDEEARQLAEDAAQAEWAAPDTRGPLDFEVEFKDSTSVVLAGRCSA
jgi:hypothetical protein